MLGRLQLGGPPGDVLVSRPCTSAAPLCPRPRLNADQPSRVRRLHALQPRLSEASPADDSPPPGPPPRYPRPRVEPVPWSRQQAMDRKRQIEAAVAKATAVRELAKGLVSGNSPPPQRGGSEPPPSVATGSTGYPGASTASTWGGSGASVGPPQQQPYYSAGQPPPPYYGGGGAEASPGPWDILEQQNQQQGPAPDIPLSPGAAAAVANAPALPAYLDFTQAAAAAAATTAVAGSSLEVASEVQQEDVLVPLEALPPPPSQGQFEQLDEAQRVSELALDRIRRDTRAAAGLVDGLSAPPRLVDIRMYDQATASRDRALEGLSKANQYTRWLETQVEDSNERVAMTHQRLAQVAVEVQTIARLARTSIASVRFSVDKKEVEEKLAMVAERMDVLHQVMEKQLQAIDRGVLREVPVSWHGVASEVRVMGSFDDWTTGTWLSAEASAKDGTFSTFQGTLLLAPGTYRIKFLVDGDWRLAGEFWPIEKDPVTQTEHNLLVVE